MSQCEEWPGPFFASGYGRIRVANKDKRVHRVIWERAHGSLKPHEHVLHACDNKRCINLEHLSVGSHQQNMAEAQERRRFANQRKTHCPDGHPYDEVNTYFRPDGARTCKECNRARAREYQRRRRASLRSAK